LFYNINKMKIYKKILSGERGASAVEFAIILPILIMLIFGIVQFGIAYNKYIAVTHAVREGARLAAVGLYEDPDFDFEQAVRDSAPTIEIETITVENPEGLKIGNPVSVTITVEVFFIDIPMAGRWGPIQLNSQATMRRER
jgi:Flp pilus assembly protein TadG